MRRAIDISLGSGLTNLPVDNARAVMVIRSARTPEDRAEILRLVLHKRAVHRTWVTLNQRKWQLHGRTISPRTCAIRKARWGNKHDNATILRAEREAIATREKYVRCS